MNERARKRKRKRENVKMTLRQEVERRELAKNEIRRKRPIVKRLLSCAIIVKCSDVRQELAT